MAIEKDKRLLNRAWLIQKFDYIIEEAAFYRLHKENFNHPRMKLWDIGGSEGRTKYAVAQGSEQISQSVPLRRTGTFCPVT